MVDGWVDSIFSGYIHQRVEGFTDREGVGGGVTSVYRRGTGVGWREEISSRASLEPN